MSINKEFHLPRWRNFPEIDLYIDQLVSYLEQYLSNYIINDEEKDGKIVTKTMINNYVKHNVIKPPVNKKYNREHLAYLFAIFLLKQIYSIGEVKMLLDLAIKTSPIDQAYDMFCNELEKAIKLTFENKTYVDKVEVTKEQYLLRNVVQSFANKLYVQKKYLKK